ncbi:acyltransferase family protein [Gemmiger formicilis]|uniref:acyltransferase family protein n=1 Tax=Gemmiger formicilis TaxID=745368 RepID=UPI00242A811A|nr:acyltransferase [Gemmiger formicilis]
MDCYKGVLIVLVVLGHIFEYSVSDWNHNILENLIWAVQMPGFMLVSGYFSFRDVKNAEKLLVGYRKSVERYLLPFLTWFVLISVLLLGNYEHDVLTALISLAWRVDGGLWFIWVVFVLSLVMGLCNLIRGKVNGFVKQFMTVAVTVGVSYGVLLILAKLTSINFLGIKFILYYGLFYGLGWFIRWTQSFWEKQKTVFYDTVAFICICIFAAITFNVNLYLIDDNIAGIMLRFIAGTTGNYVLYYVVKKLIPQLQKIKMDWIGMYTLEIYVTHMYTNHLFAEVANDAFFTILGFSTFTVSLICTVVLTGIVIVVLKSIPATNYLFYGKRK